MHPLLQPTAWGKISTSGLYTAPNVTGPETVTITATSVQDGSKSASATILVIPVAGTPVFSPAPGTYPLPQTITITSGTPGTSIHYTTDGSTPTETTGNVYSGPITLNGGTANLKAIAYGAGLADSVSLRTNAFSSGFGSPSAVDVICLGMNGITGRIRA